MAGVPHSRSFLYTSRAGRRQTAIYITSKQGKLFYGGLRGDPVPSEGDEGFLYLIAYKDNQKVYKWGFFRVTQVFIEPEARD